MNRVLLLLTHQFPHDRGDAAFVRNEIGDLSEEFDEVRIVSFWGEGEPALPLPANCRYLGSIGRVTPTRALRSLLSRRRLRTLRAVAAHVRRTGSFQAAADIRAMLVGTSVAMRLQQLGARRNPSESLTVYSFWGVDIAYGVPWFVEPHDAVAVRVHRYDLDEESEGYRPLRPAVLGVTDLLLTISDAAQAYARQRYAAYISPQRILVRRLGVPGPAVSAAPVPSERVHAVSASSIIPLKRVGLILDVLAEVARRGHPVDWTHFGDGPELAALRSRAEEITRQLPMLTATFPGRVPVQTILDHYAHVPTTMFVNLSTIEGVPVSIMEAAAYGVPAVATDVGATRELVSAALGSGVLVPPDAAVSEIADAVLDVIEHSDRFDARANWAHRFDARETARATATVIAHLTRG